MGCGTMTLFRALIDKFHELYIVLFNADGKNFVLKYQDKQIHVSCGKPSKQFTEDCRKLCVELGLDKALIMGYFNGWMKLHFSHQIRKEDHQKFRNIWHINK